jgi:serine protease AprX
MGKSTVNKKGPKKGKESTTQQPETAASEAPPSQGASAPETTQPESTVATQTLQQPDSTLSSSSSPDEGTTPATSLTKGGPIPGIQGSDPKQQDFAPVVLEKTVIAMPLFKKFEEERAKMERGEITDEPLYDVIIDVNLRFFAGRQGARGSVQKLIDAIIADNTIQKNSKARQGVFAAKSAFSQQYVFARLEENVIKQLVVLDGKLASEKEGKAVRGRAIYHIWPDFEVTKLTTVSMSTVKADAARNAFGAFGSGIIWAVMDSGIDGAHPHFVEHRNLELPPAPDPLQHRDFTALNNVPLSTDDDPSIEDLLVVGDNEQPLADEFGHGTHVAGIIAGELRRAPNHKMFATTMHRDENRVVKREQAELDSDISGMAPRCKLVSIKVLDQNGKGNASNLIAAIQWIQEINGHGRRVRIHGVNMSVGYEYDPEWFACGQSPLCVEVERLVKSGVVVVVAAGNTGYGFVQAQGKKVAVTAGLDLTINDPGNAELAITVGSTHREKPHIYGVSYFSSKGPTGDGRLKPDLLGPGEKIISCYSSQRRSNDPQPDVGAHAAEPIAANPAQPDSHPANTAVNTTANTATDTAGPGESPPPPPANVAAVAASPPDDMVIGYYKEDSGTSMAAPHVSGVIAAFLSVRREFIGRPEDVKEIFLATATDLRRDRYFQGRGLVDLMRAIQSV